MIKICALGELVKRHSCYVLILVGFLLHSQFINAAHNAHTRPSGPAACHDTAIMSEATSSHTGCNFYAYAFPVRWCLGISYETMR